MTDSPVCYILYMHRHTDKHTQSHRLSLWRRKKRKREAKKMKQNEHSWFEVVEFIWLVFRVLSIILINYQFCSGKSSCYQSSPIYIWNGSLSRCIMSKTIEENAFHWSNHFANKTILIILCNHLSTSILATI